MVPMASLPPPPAPPRPDRAVSEPAPVRRRGRAWVVAIAGLLVVSVAIAAVIPSTSGGHAAEGERYTFLARAYRGGPVRWNPCAPIHYVVNAALAPPGSIEDVHEAAQRIAGATGIAFAYDGVTDERPSRFRDPYQPDRYGERWAPVLIAWADPDSSDIPFRGEDHIASAVAAPLFPNSSVEQVYVSGWVVLNAEDPNPPGFAHVGDQGPVLLHELAHVMGLGHVQRWGQIMNEAGGGRVDLGDGDREGLRRVGSEGGCVWVPPAQP
jgi:hypothetical protein